MILLYLRSPFWLLLYSGQLAIWLATVKIGISDIIESVPLSSPCLSTRVAVESLAFDTIASASVHRLQVLKPQKSKLPILEYRVEIEYKLPLTRLFTWPNESVYMKNNASKCNVTLELYCTRTIMIQLCHIVQNNQGTKFLWLATLWIFTKNFHGCMVISKFSQFCKFICCNIKFCVSLIA